MFGARLTQLASMGWSLSVVALVLKSGLLVAPVAPLASKQDPLSVSIAVLKQSEAFKAAAVGEAGITPNEVLAWRVIFHSPDRYSVFRDVLATGSPSGRLYALAGLWFGNAAEFAAGAQKLRTEGGMISDRYSVFRDVLATGSPSGRLYALAGLWFGNAAEFAAGAQKLRTEGGMITTVRGCIVSSESLDGLIDEITAGDWSREFLAAGRVIMVR